MAVQQAVLNRRREEDMQQRQRVCFQSSCNSSVTEWRRAELNRVAFQLQDEAEKLLSYTTLGTRMSQLDSIIQRRVSCPRNRGWG